MDFFNVPYFKSAYLVCQLYLHYYLFYWTLFQIQSTWFLFTVRVFYVYFFLHFSFRDRLQWFHSEIAICLPFLFLAKQLFSQITVLFEASDNIPVSWGTEPSVYLLPASHSIQPPFNYRAGHNSVFPHHTPSALRPSFNDETSAPGGLDICFIIIILRLIFSGLLSFLSCRCVLVSESGGIFVHASFFIFRFVFFCFVFLSHFALKLEIWRPELECAISLFHTYGYSFTWIHCDFTLNLSSLQNL